MKRFIRFTLYIELFSFNVKIIIQTADDLDDLYDLLINRSNHNNRHLTIHNYQQSDDIIKGKIYYPHFISKHNRPHHQEN